jgi:hypothetical protein
MYRSLSCNRNYNLPAYLVPLHNSRQQARRLI